MALEIEKRFLLKTLPRDIKWDDTLHITQFYTKEGRYRMSHSLATGQTSFYLTIKTFISAGVNEEVETKISAQDYWTKLDQAEKAVKKVRYIKKDKKLKWEVDVFETLSIVIAEIEVPTEKELKKIKPAKWMEPFIILDITEFKQFSNYNLAETV